MKSKDQILTREEFERLWNAAQDSLDKIILTCGGILGMRVSEISKLDLSCLDFQALLMLTKDFYQMSFNPANLFY